MVAEKDAHVFRYELGGPAVHSGLAMKPIVGERGLFGPETVRESMNGDGIHFPPTRLLCLENTHNGGGGKVWPIDLVRDVCATRRELGLALHLDGARLLNAVVATGTPAADLRSGVRHRHALSLEGPRLPARRPPRRLGGPHDEGASPEAPLRRRDAPGRHRRGRGYYALEHHVDRLADDHANAASARRRVAGAGFPSIPAEVETNFVLLDARALGLGSRRPRPASGQRASCSLRPPGGDTSSSYAPRRVRGGHRARDRRARRALSRRCSDPAQLGDAARRRACVFACSSSLTSQAWPNSLMAWMIGSSASPFAVSSYSTLGGDSG